MLLESFPACTAQDHKPAPAVPQPSLPTPPQFFFTAPEELARPPVGLEFKDLVHQVRCGEVWCGVCLGGGWGRGRVNSRLAAWHLKSSSRAGANLGCWPPLRWHRCLKQRGSLLPPPHLQVQDLFDAEAAARHEAACKKAVAAVMEQCDARVRDTVSLDGHVGCVFERSPYCHAVVRGHVCAVFAGEIAGGANALSNLGCTCAVQGGHRVCSCQAPSMCWSISACAPLLPHRPSSPDMSCLLRRCSLAGAQPGCGAPRRVCAGRAAACGGRRHLAGAGETEGRPRA